MRRVQILVVIVALLATPLALLARAMACESATCTMMCCLPHGPHSGPSMPCQCSGKSHKSLPDFGLIAPIAPTAPEKFATLGAPDAVRQSIEISSQAPTQGFSVGPFNPPRA